MRWDVLAGVVATIATVTTGWVTVKAHLRSEKERRDAKVKAQADLVAAVKALAAATADSAAATAALEKKMDSKFDTLEKKMDSKFGKLDDKLDSFGWKHTAMLLGLAVMVTKVFLP